MASSEPVNKKQKIETEETLLEEIDTCQNEIDALNEQASEEILKIEQKYNKLRKPFYEKRALIIEKVDKFWLTTFINHPRISSILQDQEEDCLHYMTKLHVEDFDDVKTGYRISFHFKENPYFENDVLTKEFHLAAENQSDNFSQTSTATQIKWKEGKDLLKELQSKPQSNKKRDVDHKSFFEWFLDTHDPPNDDIAETLKDDIFPNPLQYFLVPDIGVYNDEDESGAEDEIEEGSEQEIDDEEELEEEAEDGE
ncbi:protein SET [Chironomus tepperi]|uniref:protein SET n=1 Tax=Chironomus tepperi TaxID=113505 RepID=UPI00391F205C